MLAINILMIIFAILMAGMGIFLHSHQTKPFLVFHPENDPLLKSIFQKFAFIFIAIAVISILILIFKNVLIICIDLFIGCIAIFAFQMIIVRFFPKG
ncbi:hypothetical protein WR164_06300 [Philodulcilactobacillus myokoensis]|uniref:DUF3784 domain-containing protein n=1 Tax=Philodulcilactobacillus myokoensis TaxID=2929573 RepID=A0A9W6B162_9LACO|nr:hypothetical protein [Philodulcilactobacillus myokoensis]GLB46651.1 hypothetical protein WR164_06300 [Philodulcilactobacillus myokoensis]